MVQGKDLDVLRDIPGYKAILKALIKSQIQHLVEQLSSHTDEEAVLLSVSISDGSLSHLGSESGRVFLESHEDIKSKFLGFCLKRQHKIQTEESQVKSPPPVQPLHSPPHKRKKFSPYASPGPSTYVRNRAKQFTPKTLPQQSPVTSLSVGLTSLSAGVNPLPQSRQQDEGGVIKTESDLDSSDRVVTDTYSDYIRQTSQDIGSGGGSSQEQDSCTSVSDSAGSVNVKTEPESEEDLTITGVEYHGGGAESEQGESEWLASSDGFVASNDRLQSNTQMPVSMSTSSSSSDLERLPNGHYVCPICQKEDRCKYNVIRHLRTHTGERPYRCELCFKTFADKSNLNRHHKTVHVLQHSDLPDSCAEQNDI